MLREDQENAGLLLVGMAVSLGSLIMWLSSWLQGEPDHWRWLALACGIVAIFVGFVLIQLLFEAWCAFFGHDPEYFHALRRCSRCKRWL